MTHDEAQVIAEALVALRRAAGCQSLPRHSRRALEAGAELLELHAPRRVLRAVPSHAQGKEAS